MVYQSPRAASSVPTLVRLWHSLCNDAPGAEACSTFCDLESMDAKSEVARESERDDEVTGVFSDLDWT